MGAWPGAAKPLCRAAPAAPGTASGTAPPTGRRLSWPAGTSATSRPTEPSIRRNGCTYKADTTRRDVGLRERACPTPDSRCTVLGADGGAAWIVGSRDHGRQLGTAGPAWGGVADACKPVGPAVHRPSCARGQHVAHGHHTQPDLAGFPAFGLSGRNPMDRARQAASGLDADVDSRRGYNACSCVPGECRAGVVTRPWDMASAMPPPPCTSGSPGFSRSITHQDLCTVRITTSR